MNNATEEIAETLLEDVVENGNKISTTQTRKLDDNEEDAVENVPKKIIKLSENVNVEIEDTQAEEKNEDENYDLNDLKDEEYAENNGENSKELLDSTNDFDDEEEIPEDYEVISDSDNSIGDQLDLEQGEETYEGDSDDSEAQNEQDDLIRIKGCQKEIEVMNQKANMEILLVEQKYNKLKKPIFQKRNRFISRVPNFWSKTLTQHPQLKSVMTSEDINCLRYLNELIVQDFKNDRSTGYKIKFIFDENPWFEDSMIIKEYHLPWHGLSSCTCSTIHWKENMNLTTRESSFFCWFSSHKDTSADDIAEIIKEELWTDPLRIFANETTQENPGQVVMLDETIEDDESIEYISSGDEEAWGQVGSEEDVTLDDTQNSEDQQKIEISENSILEDEEVLGEYDESDGEEFGDGTIDLERDSDVEVEQNATDSNHLEEDSRDNLNTSGEVSAADTNNINESSCDTNGVRDSEDPSTQEIPLSLKSNIEPSDDESQDNSLNKKIAIQTTLESNTHTDTTDA